MENKDFNFEEIKKRMENYQETPDVNMWRNIEKQISPRHIYLKTAIGVCSALLVAFVGVLVFTPKEEKVESSKQIAQNIEKIQEVNQEKNNIKKSENISAVYENISADYQNISAKKINISAKKLEETSSIETEIVSTEKQEAFSDKVLEKEVIKPIEITEESKSLENLKEEKIEVVSETKTIAPEIEEVKTRVQLFIPNAFTPESGNENSIFKPAFTEVKEYRMDIYASNRGLVFSTNNIEEGWDGNYKGNPQPTGVYVYIVKFTNADGITSTQKGKLMLIR